MTIRDTDREAIRERLQWLRLMGLDEIGRAPSAVPRPAAIREPAPAPARPGPAPARESRDEPAPPLEGEGVALFQQALFGEAVAPSIPAASPARRGEARSASPLAAAPKEEPGDPAAALQSIREDIGECTRCRLCEKRTNVVFGVGSPRAQLMFVGEGPGADEDLQGEPFVGRAGQLLTKIIESMGLRRADVYIANIVKCRPPENRTPLPDEVATCAPFLFRQIHAIRPRVIVCLGTPATQTLLGTRETITRLRGTPRQVEGFTIVPTFHPAYLLRNPAAKREVWEDMKKVMALLKSE